MDERYSTVRLEASCETAFYCVARTFSMAYGRPRRPGPGVLLRSSIDNKREVSDK